MFGLLLLNDGSYHICDIKRIINRRKDNSCTVKLPKKETCDGRLLASHKSCEVLVDIKRSLNNGSPKVHMKPLILKPITPNTSFHFDLSSTESSKFEISSCDQSNDSVTATLQGVSVCTLNCNDVDQDAGLASVDIDLEKKLPTNPKTYFVAKMRRQALKKKNHSDDEIISKELFLTTQRSNSHQCYHPPQSSSHQLHKQISDDHCNPAFSVIVPAENVHTSSKLHRVFEPTNDTPNLRLTPLQASTALLIENRKRSPLGPEPRVATSTENSSINLQHQPPQEISCSYKSAFSTTECDKSRSENLNYSIGTKVTNSTSMLPNQVVDNSTINISTELAGQNSNVNHSSDFNRFVAGTNNYKVEQTTHPFNFRFPICEQLGVVLDDNLNISVDSLFTDASCQDICFNAHKFTDLNITTVESNTMKSDMSATVVEVANNNEESMADENGQEDCEKDGAKGKLVDQTVGNLLAGVSQSSSDSDNDDIIDSDCDLDYQPHLSESSTDDNDDNGDRRTDSESEPEKRKTKEKKSKNASTNSGRFSISFSGIQEGTAHCDDSNTIVETSKGPAGGNKRDFCFYCAKEQSKISRHLIRKHHTEKDVKEIAALPVGSAERRSKFDKVRKRGNFLFNTNPEHNDGRHFVVRRPNAKFKRTAKHFAYCGKCKGSYSRNTISIHFAKCTGLSSKKNRLVMLSSKQVAGRIHPSANDVVRQRIFPVLRDDVVTCAIRYDKLMIAFVNKQTKKYMSQHFDKMIRSRIRVLGRFLLSLRQINKKVTDLGSVFDPEVYDDAISAVNNVAGLDDISNVYKAPSTASSLGMLLKLMGKIHISICIKTKQNEKMKDAEDFLKLLDEDYTVSVNKTVAESQAQQKRRKKIILPSTGDVRKLHDHLERERKKAFENVNIEFSVARWRKLAETTLTSIQLFNRRRAGEIERILIDDFNNHQGIDKAVDNDLYRQLSETMKSAANKYVRFTIRGKLNRTVPVLLNAEMLECVRLIIKHRKDAKVSNTNPYVFGMPTNNKTMQKYLSSCLLMRKFSTECGASNPKSLRETELRKHMATKCISLNLNEQDVGDVANFMGHSTDIHKNVYRQTIVSREIIKISKLLEKAQGADVESDSEDESNKGDFDNSDVDSDVKMKKQLLEANASGESTTLHQHEVSESFESSFTGTYPHATENRGPLQSVNGTKEQSNETNSGDSQSKGKRRRSGSPRGPVKRVAWTRPEKDCILNEFGRFINSDAKKFPSLKSIGEFMSKVPELKARTPQQVKAWMSNQKQANRRSEFS